MSLLDYRDPWGGDHVSSGLCPHLGGCAYFRVFSLLSLAASLRAGMCGGTIYWKKRTLVSEPVCSGHKWKVGFGTSRLSQELNVASSSACGSLVSHASQAPLKEPLSLKPVILKYEQQDHLGG